MGSSPSMIFNNYLSLIFAEEAATFWSIKPDSAANIVEFEKAG